MTKRLVELANKLDSLGYIKLANDIDDILIKRAYSFQFFHGTSSNNLHKILKEGLNSSPKSRVWEEDDKKRQPGNIGLESYPGAYVSSNFMTAYSAATTATEKFGGNRLIVSGTIETRTPEARIDEDHIREPGAGVSIQDKLISDWYTRPQLLDTIAFETNDSQLESIAKTWIEEALGIKVTDELIKRGKKVLRAWLDARIALQWERDKKATSIIYYGGTERFLKQRFGENIPAIFDDPKLAVRAYRAAMDEFLAKAKELLTKPKDSFMMNVRLTKNIAYKGANKIGAIIEIEKDKDWTTPTKIYVRLATDKEALSQLIHRYKTDIGSNYELIYP